MPLNAICTADQQNRIIQHLQRTLHLCGKIHMTGSVKKCDLRISQREKRLLGKDRDSSASFQFVGIKKCITMIHSSHFSDCSTGIQYTFRQCSLPCIDMGYNARTYIFFRFILRCIIHQKYPFLSSIIQLIIAQEGV